MPKRSVQSTQTQPAGAPQRDAPPPDAPPLPPGWVWTTLGEVADFIRGVSYRKTDSRNETASGYVPILRATNIQDNRLILNRELVFVPRTYVKQEQYLRPGDIVICISSGSKHLVGKAAILDREWFGSFGTFLAVARPKPDVEAKFMGYFLASPQYRNAIQQRSSGININNLRIKDLTNLPFPLAPLPEQRRIVARIEELFSQLDAAEEGLRRVQRNLKRYRAAVLKAAVEGRLVPRRGGSETPPYETGEELLQRILAERRRKWEEQEWANLVEKAKKKAAQARRKARGLPARIKDIPPDEWQVIPEEEYRRYLPKDDRWKQKYKEPTPPDTSSLSPLPEGWTWATVDMISETIGGVTKGRRLVGRKTIQVPYLRVANVQRGYLDLQVIKSIEIPEEELGKYVLQEHDVLLTEGGDWDKLGRAAVWREQIKPCIHQNHIFRARPFLFKETLGEWIAYVANSELGQRYFTNAAKQTTNLASINLTQLRACPIPLPPLAEQRHIVAEVERRLSVAQEAEKAVEANLKRIARLRQAILKRAFAGKLVPQDPNDEPADVLLARIRAGEAAIQDLPLFQIVGATHASPLR